MDLRGHEGADMASLPLSSTNSFMEPSNMHEGVAANITKVKIITTSTSEGSHGNNGLAAAAAAAGGAVGGGGSGNNNNGIPRGLTSGNNGPHIDDLRVASSLELKIRKPVKYRECLKNHAANLGVHANDGCGEFMPSGEEGTLEALKCAACNCHRNFHRRDVEGELSAACDCRYGPRDRKRIIEPLFPSPPPHIPLPLPPPPGLQLHPMSGRPPPPSQMIMAFNPQDSDEYDAGLLSPQSPLKKRFRTKFTVEQKEQMCVFAEKLGWRIQKHDEGAVQQFCADIGVKRHVLKVWMHNNKHTLGKKLTHGCISMDENEIRS